MKRLDRRTALVTGGGSGLGKAIATRLEEDGAQVVITDVQVELGRAAAAAKGHMFLEQDVCNEARWSEVVREIEGQFGALHILVNNAGILGPMDEVTPEESTLASWRNLFMINVESVFLGCRAAIPAISRSGGGSIVNISSVAGLLASPYATAYGASKAAVRQFTKTVAQHCAQRKLNIRCNSVHPGDVRTPLWDKQAMESAVKRGRSFADIVAEAETACPLGRLTEPEDVAAMVSFLASDDSRQVTGAALVVDGGVVDCDTFHMMSAVSQP